jgi:hypothetical protein
VLVAEEVLLRPLCFDDPEPLPEHRRDEVDLDTSRADHPDRRVELERAFAQDFVARS